MTEWGYKATKEDLIEFMKEISESEHPPDIAFTQRVTDLMHQNVSTVSLAIVHILLDNSAYFAWRQNVVHEIKRKLNSS